MVAEDATVRAVSAVPTYGMSDGWLQRTPLRAREIGAIPYNMQCRFQVVVRSRGDIAAQTAGQRVDPHHRRRT